MNWVEENGVLIGRVSGYRYELHRTGSGGWYWTRHQDPAHGFAKMHPGSHPVETLTEAQAEAEADARRL